MNKITIIGLGSGSLDQLTLKAYKLLKNNFIYLRTEIHPCIDELKKEGIKFHSFDKLYQEGESFEEVYNRIVDFLIDRSKEEDIYYAVPGNPFFNEKTVDLLVKSNREIDIEIVPGISYLDTIADSLRIDLGNSLQLTDSYSLLERKVVPNLNQPILINEVWSRYYLSELKLLLMMFYNDETEVVLIKHAGLYDEEIIKTELYLLDHYEVDHLTSLFIDKQEDQYRSFEKLVEVTRTLRSPEGCPWDREQTHESLKRYLIEEVYETIQALDNNDIDNLQEELGDLLFEILIHTQIAEEENNFTIYDVINDITEKMIRRHPHVFGETIVNSSGEVLKKWDEIKDQEKNKKSIAEDMKNIPLALPSLLVSDKVQRKAARVGFDWDNALLALDKVLEEVQEVKETLNNQEGHNRIREELGDLLFASVNVARLSDIEPEEALRLANNKFINRFAQMEEEAREKNLNMNDLSLDELENLWDLIKLKEKDTY